MIKLNLPIGVLVTGPKSENDDGRDMSSTPEKVWKKLSTSSKFQCYNFENCNEII